MTLYILAGGCDGLYPEYIEQLGRVVRTQVIRPKILFCEFASEDVRAEARFLKHKKMFEEGFGSFETITMATKDRFIEEVRGADIIYFHGGRTSTLLDAMQMYSGIKKEFSGKIIIGTSAGANYLSSRGFSPSTGKVSEGSGIVDVAIVAHYGSSGFEGMSFDTGYWKSAVEAVRAASGKDKVALIPEGTFAVFEE